MNAISEQRIPIPFTTLEIMPDNENLPFDMYEFIDRIVDKDTFFEIKKLYAPEIITGFEYVSRPVSLWI